MPPYSPDFPIILFLLTNYNIQTQPFLFLSRYLEFLFLSDWYIHQMPHSQSLLPYLEFLSARFLYSLQIMLQLSLSFLLQTLLFLNLHSFEMHPQQSPLAVRIHTHLSILPDFLVSLFLSIYYHFQMPCHLSSLNFLIILRLTILCSFQMLLVQYW